MTRPVLPVAALDEVAWRVPRADGGVSMYGASRVTDSLAEFLRGGGRWVVWRSDWTVRRVDALVASCTSEGAARAALALMTEGISVRVGEESSR